MKMTETGVKGVLLMAVTDKGKLEILGSEKATNWLEDELQMQYLFMANCLGIYNRKHNLLLMFFLDIL